MSSCSQADLDDHGAESSKYLLELLVLCCLLLIPFRFEFLACVGSSFHALGSSSENGARLSDEGNAFAPDRVDSQVASIGHHSKSGMWDPLQD